MLGMLIRCFLRFFDFCPTLGSILIMRSTIMSRLLATLCVSLCATPLVAIAQANAPQASPVGAPLPPRLEKLDEIKTSDVTARAAASPPAGPQGISQTRQQGQVSEVKVQSGQSTYYLKPNQQAGSAMAGDAQGSTMRAPQWKVLEFNLDGSGDKKDGEKAQAAAPPPPGIPPPAKK